MSRFHQRGMSLVSLLISLTIGMLLLAGLFDLWLQTRNTFNSQDSLAQLQDNERTAMTLVASAIQTGGYYPVADNYHANPYATVTTPPSPLYTATTVFTANSTFGVQQFLAGTHTAGSNDTLYVRFMSDGNSLDCLGQLQADRTLVTMKYTVDGNGNLTCTVNTGTAQAVVSGLANFTVNYGVDTTGAGSVTQYMTADKITSTNWPNVHSVQLQLTFKNPLYGQPGQSANLPVVYRNVVITQSTTL